MNSLFKKIKNLNSNNLILYNHTTRKLIKSKNKLKFKFNGFFKEIIFEFIYHVAIGKAKWSIFFVVYIFTGFQFKTFLYYMYHYNHKIPFMTYYIADDLEKFDTDNIRMIDADELNAKKIQYAYNIKYY